MSRSLKSNHFDTNTVANAADNAKAHWLLAIQRKLSVQREDAIPEGFQSVADIVKTTKINRHDVAASLRFGIASKIVQSKKLHRIVGDRLRAIMYYKNI